MDGNKRILLPDIKNTVNLTPMQEKLLRLANLGLSPNNIKEQTGWSLRKIKHQTKVIRKKYLRRQREIS